LHCRHLARDDLLLHLLGQGILQSKMVPSVYQQLVLEVLRRVEILASRLLPVTASLNTVVAGSHPPVLHLHIGGWVGELALRI